MAIINCPECSKDISEKSKACIHCGYPLEEKEVLNVGTSFNRFSVIFILFMLPTYLLRGSFLYSSFSLLSVDTVNAHGNTMNVLMLLCYFMMVAITHNRAKALNKNYITVFPILSAIFDIFLIFIPLVPTILNIVTILLLRPVDNEVHNEEKTILVTIDKCDKWDDI